MMMAMYKCTHVKQIALHGQPQQQHNAGWPATASSNINVHGNVAWWWCKNVFGWWCKDVFGWWWENIFEAWWWRCINSLMSNKFHWMASHSSNINVHSNVVWWWCKNVFGWWCKNVFGWWCKNIFGAWWWRCINALMSNKLHCMASHSSNINVHGNVVWWWWKNVFGWWWKHVFGWMASAPQQQSQMSMAM